MSEQQIIAQLQGDDVEAIREAAYAAGNLRLESAVPYLVARVQSDNVGVQEAADRALRKIRGVPVVRGVLPLLRSDDAPIRNIAMDVLREVGADDFDSLKQLLHDDDPDMRIFASDILGTSESILAVPPLCEALLRDPEVNVRYQAAVSLGTLAFPDAAECLDKAMMDEEWVQFSVIEALTKIRAESSVDALAKALNASSDLVASMIVDALGEMGNIKAVPLLLKRLDKSPGPLRNKIVKSIVNVLGGKSLSLLGEKDRLRLRDYLLAAMEDEDEDVQDAAMRGLASIGGAEATEAVLKVAVTLHPDRDHERLVDCVRSLADIGFNSAVDRHVRGDAEHTLLILIEAIRSMPSRHGIDVLRGVFWDKPRDAQRAMSTVLAERCDPSDRDFFIDVLDKHSDAHVLKAALHYLGRKAKAMEAGERMLALLEHPYDDVKEAALDACIALNDPGMNARFRESFRSPDPLHRMMAVYAMGRFDVDENLAELTEALEDEIPDVRKVALEAVTNACPFTRERLALVVPRLHDENREVRLALVELLGGCGEGNVFPYLTQALDDPDDWVRVRAIEALGSLKDATAVPQLVALTENSGHLIVLKVVEALGSIGGNVAFRSLLHLMQSESPEVQQAAEAAAARIHEEQGVDA